MYSISFEEIDRLTSTSDPKEMAVAPRKGDFVIFPRNAEGWREGHIERVGDTGLFWVSFGSRDLPSYLRGVGVWGIPRNMGEVSELWRQRRVAKTYTFTFEGKPQTVKSSEMEWYLVWRDERYSEQVDWWAC